MEIQTIKKGVALIISESKAQNKTPLKTSVSAKWFFHQIGISKTEFVLNFSKHPFTIIRGQIMLTNGFNNY